MEMDRDQEKVVEYIGQTHAALSDFARQSFKTEGRGVVLVKFPRTSPLGPTGPAMTDMIYHPADQVRTLRAEVSASAGADHDGLVEMVDTYDPERQAVVMAALEPGGLPISIKMRLASTAPGGR